MNIQRINFSPKNVATLARRIVLPAMIALLSAGGPAFAGSGTWLLTPGSGDWNTGSNWDSGTVPNSPTDTASFDLSAITGVSISANTEVNEIIFNPNAASNPFTITASPTFTLTISGVG